MHIITSLDLTVTWTNYQNQNFQALQDDTVINVVKYQNSTHKNNTRWKLTHCYIIFFLPWELNIMLIQTCAKGATWVLPKYLTGTIYIYNTCLLSLCFCQCENQLTIFSDINLHKLIIFRQIQMTTIVFDLTLFSIYSL